MISDVSVHISEEPGTVFDFASEHSVLSYCFLWFFGLFQI
ncbi:hypothetical protein N184_33910 [Sinorhizobium sp. GL28]|nr:hypothetical protein N184_33910 [Sinorhizobium sp. GL28]